MLSMSDTQPRSANSVWASRRWVLLAIAVVYVVAGILVFRSLDKPTLERALAMPLSLLAGLLALSLFNYAIRAWRWLVLSRFLRFEIASTRNVLYYFAGYALTATPGKAGEAVRLWLLKAGHGIAYARSIPIMRISGGYLLPSRVSRSGSYPVDQRNGFGDRRVGLTTQSKWLF